MRIGKLYKLVKIIRMVRLMKVAQQGKFLKQISKYFEVSEDMEKILFLLVVFIMIGHFISCIWILIADMSCELT